MWSKELFGTDVYHLIAAFIIYSILGWLVESMYMSFCNRKLTNRGFARGPFCPIYGFGGVIGYLILSPFSGHYIRLYLLGAFLATCFEYLTGRLMQHFLGEVWWDYREKPWNYQGIICLESTIAWGFYAVIIIMFLHGRILRFIDRYDMVRGEELCVFILAVVLLDYLFRFYHIYRDARE
jgi:uncharacterized membrane protein